MPKKVAATIEPSTNGHTEPKFSFGDEYKGEGAALQPGIVYDVPVTQVSVLDGFNARDFSSPENKMHVERLSKLIAQNGVEVPLSVRVVNDRLVLVDGESRLRAALKAAEDGSEKAVNVPVLIESNQDPIYLTKMLVVRNTGKPLTMIEQLTVVKRLEALGEGAKAIQETLGFSRTAYSNLRLLGRAPEDVLEYVADNRVSATVVVDLMREYEAEPEIIVKAVEKAVRQAEKEAAPSEKPKKAKVKVKDEIIYTRGLYDGLISVLQQTYAELVPAKDWIRARKRIKNALENINAPLAFEPEEEVIEE